MTRNAKLAFDDENVVETVGRLLRAAGKTEAFSVLKSSRWEFEETGYDNWNGGTYSFTLFVNVTPEMYQALLPRLSQVEEHITESLKSALTRHSDNWYTAKIAPLIVELPGRLDLKGGPISFQVRKDIIAFLRHQKVKWNGELPDSSFLLPVFDLQSMPSTDSRFEDALGDIVKHRELNEDWDDDWIYTDSRINLLKCADERFLRFVERLVDPDVVPDTDVASKLADRLNKFLRLAGWNLTVQETFSKGVYHKLETWHQVSGTAIQSLRLSAAVLTSSSMHLEIARLEQSVDTDPALVIGTCKEIVETCCKHLVEKLNLSVADKPELPELVRVVLKGLDLVPDSISEKAKGAQTIKRLLSNLSQITQGLAEIRSLYGTGHGKPSNHRGLNSRHARLALSSTSAFVEFVVTTYEERTAVKSAA